MLIKEKWKEFQMRFMEKVESEEADNDDSNSCDDGEQDEEKANTEESKCEDDEEDECDDKEKKRR